MAGMWYRFGKSGSLRIETHAELAQDGHFVIYCSAPDYGQGTATAMSQISAEILGVSRDEVELINADTALTPDSGVQGASRATYWVGNSVSNAAKNLKEEVLGVAAEILDCQPDALRFSGGAVHAPHAPGCSIALRDVATEFDRLGKSRKVVGVFDPSPMFPEETRPSYTPHFVTGGHLAQVVVDTETGQTQVLRMVAAHDVGKVINRPGAEGQVEGSILMGLGSALTEMHIPDGTMNFSTYILPMIGEMPEIETILVEVPSFYSPMGVKGLGEAPMLPSTPAIINAISRAIGVRVRRIPATPERVLWAIRGRSE
jgi:CO/xanthine dehydrogenase Mo-binding subunit